MTSARSPCVEVAVLLGLNDPRTQPGLLGHVVWHGAETVTRNDYPTLQKIINCAADGGVRTPRILASVTIGGRTL